MPYERPFVTGRYTAYRGDSVLRRLSLAVMLVDVTTGKRPMVPFRVFLKERRSQHRRGGEPIVNPSGFHCFLDVPDGDYTIVVEPSADGQLYDLRPEPGTPWGGGFERQVTLPRPDALEPVVELELSPNTGYPFPANATLVRGRVQRNGSPAPGAVVSTDYQQAAPTTLDPRRTVSSTTATPADQLGHFVLFFEAPSPATQQLQITATAPQGQQTLGATIREERTTPDVDFVLP